MNNVQAAGTAFGNAYGAGYTQGLQDAQASGNPAPTPAVPSEPKPAAAQPKPRVQAPPIVIIHPLQQLPPRPAMKSGPSDGSVAAAVLLGFLGTGIATAGVYWLAHSLHKSYKNTYQPKSPATTGDILSGRTLQSWLNANPARPQSARPARSAEKIAILEQHGNIQEQQVGGLSAMHAANSMINDIRYRATPEEFRAAQRDMRGPLLPGQTHNDFSPLGEMLAIFNARMQKLEETNAVAPDAHPNVTRRLAGLDVTIPVSSRLGDALDISRVESQRPGTFATISGDAAAPLSRHFTDGSHGTDRMMVMVSRSADRNGPRGHWVTLAHSPADGFWRVIDSKKVLNRIDEESTQPKIKYDGGFVHNERPTAHDAERALRGYLAEYVPVRGGEARHVSIAIPVPHPVR